MTGMNQEVVPEKLMVVPPVRPRQPSLIVPVATSERVLVVRVKVAIVYVMTSGTSQLLSSIEHDSVPDHSAELPEPVAMKDPVLSGQT